MEIIAAMTNNYVIGKDGDMPWHLPADLAHFKKLTSGHVIVMGRRTWESIGCPLPNRLNVVLTRQTDYDAKGAVVVHSLGEAIKVGGEQRIFVIGGGELYAQALQEAMSLHVTRIDATIDGDTCFPVFDEANWLCEHKVNRPADDNNQYSLVFETWTKKI